MKLFIFCILTIVTLNLNAQNYIGLHKDSIIVLIKKYEKSFRLDQSTVNKYYNYLKYVDGINEQTWLFFLDKDNKCTYNKLMSDYLNYPETVKKLDEKYSRSGKNEWFYTIGEKEFLVKIVEEEWYFTIITREKIE